LKTKSRPGSSDIGLLNDHGIGQSEFMWYIRGNPNVKKVFSYIWNSNELFTSFDGAGCYRNWYFNKKWKTKSGWYHCDQVNIYYKISLIDFYGFIYLRIHFENLIDVQSKVLFL
jgi:hypothetical protein